MDRLVVMVDPEDGSIVPVDDAEDRFRQNVAKADAALEFRAVRVVLVDDRAPEDTAQLLIDHQNHRVPFVEGAQVSAPMADLAGLHHPIAGQIGRG